MEQTNHSNNFNKDDRNSSTIQDKSKSNSPKKQKSGQQNENNNSPSKSRNKRKNEAKRKNGTNKKQQQGGSVSKEPLSEKTKGQTVDDEPLPQSSLSSSEQNSPTDVPPPSIKSVLEETNHLEQDTQNQQQPDGVVEQVSDKKQQAVTKNLPCNKETSNNHKDKQEIELKELKNQLTLQSNQMKNFLDQIKQQRAKIKELETALLITNRSCGQLERLLQQELASKTRLEGECENLEQHVIKLKNQIGIHEKNKTNDEELIRVLNATLMERETEVSILKLKLTRLQTNPSSSVGLNSLVSGSISSMKQQQLTNNIDPCKAFISSGRSNSEFDRSSYIRSSMRAEQASVRASTTQLRSNDKDASVWATVPEELTPSKRPLALDRSFQSIYGNSSSSYNPYGNIHSLVDSNQISTPLVRDRRYKTLPRSIKSPEDFKPEDKITDNKIKGEHSSEQFVKIAPNISETTCKVTNLDDSNSTSMSSGGNRTSNTNTLNNADRINKPSESQSNSKKTSEENINAGSANKQENKNTEEQINNETRSMKISDSLAQYSNIASQEPVIKPAMINDQQPSLLADRVPTTPVKTSSGIRKIFDKFRRSDSSTSNSRSKTDLSNIPLATPEPSPFKRNAARSTMVGAPKDIRAQISPIHGQASNLQTDKPFAEWDTDMIVDWLTMIGLSMYTAQCRRWVKCGAHIMNATPAEVDKGFGITNHLHRKKLRLAISELNGDCDKITKAASKLDYLWVARWLDDMGLPQYKEAFINARIDGRVLNYLTVEDLVSLGVKSVLHHSSIKCGIKVLRSIKFDLQLLKRRATSDEIEQMSSMRQKMDQVAGTSNSINKQTPDEASDNGNDLALWTCHRVMEWLRMIDFSEFAPNLRGSGVHGALIAFEDGFNIDTMCSLLSIPTSRTLLRRHLATFFKELIGNELALRKRQYQEVSFNQKLNPLAEIKLAKKPPWFSRLKSSKVFQDAANLEEYLCPMYPVEPDLIKSPSHRKNDTYNRPRELTRIPESINV